MTSQRTYLSASCKLLCAFIILEYQHLCDKASVYRRGGYRPSTAANHRCMWRKYIKFCNRYKVQYVNPTIDTLCAYLQVLIDSFTSSKSVASYFGAIRLLHKYINKQAENLDAFEVTLMLRAAALNMRTIPVRKLPIPVDILRSMCEMCEAQGVPGLVIKVGILLGYYGFLRASNICPKSARTFDLTRHLSRADIRFGSPGLLVRLKWSKTLQRAQQPTIIPIVTSPDPALDAVAAYARMIRAIPAHASMPALILPGGVILTIDKLRRAFAAIRDILGLPSHLFNLHSLRRSGATSAYHAGASYVDIQRQGCWSSSCFMDYLAKPAPHKSSVCNALRKATSRT